MIVTRYDLRKRDLAFLGLGMMFLLFSLILCYKSRYNGSIQDIKLICSINSDINERVSLYFDEGQYYAFLPSYAEADSIYIEYSSGYEVFIDGQYCENGSKFPFLSLNQTYQVSVKSVHGWNVASGSLVVKKANSIATLSINLINGTINSINSSKEVSKKGYCSLIKADKAIDYIGEIKIHGHGNSTWSQKKKSYTIKLSQSNDLLGMGEGQNWILLANSFDESGLRNKLVLDFAKEVGVDFAVDSEYVNLYVDGVYYGLYLMTEKIEVGDNRVAIRDLYSETQVLNQLTLSNYRHEEDYINGNTVRGYAITNNPQDITGGYLVQIEHHADRIKNEKSLFQTNELSFSIASPKCSSMEQVYYLVDFFQKCEDAIRRNDLSMIDVDSFVKYYLTIELFANSDNCSVFLYKNIDSQDDKLHMCSPWDYDLSMGNGWRIADSNAEVLYRNSDNWFNYLTTNEQFKSFLAKKFEVLLINGLLKSLEKQLEEYGEQMGTSFEMDKIRWRNVKADNKDADESQLRFDSIEDHIKYLDEYLNRRVSFLNSVWINGTEYFNVSFVSDYNISVYDKEYAIINGEALPVIEEPKPLNSDEYSFIGWFDSDGNEYIPGMAITNNERYVAKWERTTSINSLFRQLVAFIKLHSLKLFSYGGTAMIGLVVVCFIMKDIRNNSRKGEAYHE